MKVIRINRMDPIKPIKEGLVVALGYFDGIHIAHMDLINKVVELGNDTKMKTGVVTFHPHPAFILNKKDVTDFLTPLEVKIDLLKKVNIDYLFIVDFDTETAVIPHKEFVQTFFVPLNIKTVVAGFDNRYGQGGEGTVDTIRSDSDNSIDVVVIPERTYRGTKIGSSYVRELLSKGDINTTTEVLGRNYSIDGFVTHGRGRGKTIGVPTANVAIKYPYSVPKKGVYLVKLIHKGKEYYGVGNIGNNPTFNFKSNPSIEINILDFDKDIYSDYVKVDFLTRIRDEKKFSSIDELVKQIDLDKEFARDYIKNN